MQNYFNYFTEIEEHFQRRRGTLLLLSTLDWALIETWREAGVPLAAVLRGIDNAFDKYETRQRSQPNKRQRHVNGLAWAAQAVLDAAEEMKEAAIGAGAAEPTSESGFEIERIAAYLRETASAMELAIAGSAMYNIVEPIVMRLRELAESATSLRLEELERTLTALEEKLFALLLTQIEEEQLVAFKAEAARGLASYRSRMGAVQLKQIEQQFVQKRLLEHYRLPRLSLFYMSQS
ncbi:MAG TPA: hypothetical protein VL346_03170 [Acidobacteriaceae bacterium]|nr:hypothetical protein [Acidobacteriaceae bacterium]